MSFSCFSLVNPHFFTSGDEKNYCIHLFDDYYSYTYHVHFHHYLSGLLCIVAFTSGDRANSVGQAS